MFFNFLLKNFLFVSIYKSGDQKSWAHSESKPDSPSDLLPPPPSIREQPAWRPEQNPALGCPLALHFLFTPRGLQNPTPSNSVCQHLYHNED